MQRKRLKSDLKVAIQINENLRSHFVSQSITIQSEGSKEVLQLSIDNFVYAENADNYVLVYFLNDNKIE